MNLEKETALIEAILFLEAEPVEEKNLVRISGLSPEAVRSALEHLRESYASEGHGMDLCEIGGGFMFSPKRWLWETLRDHYGRKSDSRLSRAALETLSIVAYSQPITRTEIENIRGVSADGMIRLHFARNFIKEVGKKDAPGKPVQYGTTREFLKIFRLSSIADLPRLDEQEMEKFELNG
jgi:segregation and condensation protein B